MKQLCENNLEMGYEALKLISEAGNFNQWMFDQISPYCEGNIVEIGSGIGNISSFLIDKSESILLTDVYGLYCEILEKKFSSNKKINIIQMDISDKNFNSKYQNYSNKFDTLVILNVVEHIENDLLALKNCKFLIKPGGKLIVLAPAFQRLYNQFDRELGHCRRYTKKLLNKKINNCGFKIIRSGYFNFIGISGWILFGSILKQKKIKNRDTFIYNKLIPYIKYFDLIFKPFLGLSIITIGEK